MSKMKELWSDNQVDGLLFKQSFNDINTMNGLLNKKIWVNFDKDKIDKILNKSLDLGLKPFYTKDKEQIGGIIFGDEGFLYFCQTRNYFDCLTHLEEIEMGGHNCEWQKYEGLLESYEYCIHCDRKRKL